MSNGSKWCADTHLLQHEVAGNEEETKQMGDKHFPVAEELLITGCNLHR